MRYLTADALPPVPAPGSTPSPELRAEEAARRAAIQPENDRGITELQTGR